MPMAAPKPCTHPGCGVLVRDGTSRCPKHPPVGSFKDKRRGSRHERGYGTAWDKQRLTILLRDKGLCQPCLERGQVTRGCEVDHKIPKADGGTDDEANLQTICPPCHKSKSEAERLRALQRRHQSAP